MPEPERIDRRRAALIAYDVCRRALTPSDPTRAALMRPVLDAWVQMIAAERGRRDGDLHDARQPRRWRRRRHAADRPFGGGATNRGVETSVREAFNLDLTSIVVRECCWSSDMAAHAYSLDKAMKMYARIRPLDQVAAMLRE